MTCLIGIRCTDGVVIGADSSATFGDGMNRYIEQPTSKKIEIIEGKLIVAGTGQVGHLQRFTEALKSSFKSGGFKDKKTEIEFAKHLSHVGVNDFAYTTPTNLMGNIGYSAFVAYAVNHVPCLCELAGLQGFQPELKFPNDLWFASAGSGQMIADPLLALFRSIFWKDGPPNLQGGIFTALWALRHTCDVNAGGIKEPIHIAVLAGEKGMYSARMLTPEELAEHSNIVDDATAHMAKFRDVLQGRVDVETPPKPPAENPPKSMPER